MCHIYGHKDLICIFTIRPAVAVKQHLIGEIDLRTNIIPYKVKSIKVNKCMHTCARAKNIFLTIFYAVISLAKVPSLHLAVCLEGGFDSVCMCVHDFVCMCVYRIVGYKTRMM